MEELSDATGVMEVGRTYSYGLDLIAQDRFDVGSSAWDATFYLYDGHGNVRALADDAGTITDTYDYDAFGTLIEQFVLDLSASGLVPVTTDNQYLYCGEQFDSELGLYFLRARYMDTDRGRFWSMDAYAGVPIDPQSLHKYLYCEDNPVSFVDPSGELTVWQVGVAITIGLFLYDVASGFQRFAWAREKIIKIKTEIEIGAYPIEYSMDTAAPHWRGFSVGMLSSYSTIGYEVTWIVIELDPPTVLVSYHSTSSSISKTFSYISKRIPTGG